MEMIAESCGAVGEISAKVYDEKGRPCAQDYNDRVIGLPLEMIKTIPFRIGVAASEAKAAAILGALRGGYMDVLITDEEAAIAVMALIDQAKKIKNISKGGEKKHAFGTA
jgi:DNA-binding transcriptional regulator LsrR (DeoR family)